MKTRAIVIPAAHTVEMRDVELKPLGGDDVLVRTRLTSISAGTERMLLQGVMPHPMLQFPVVPGYETVGEVVDAGANVSEWIGRRVYVGGNYGFIGVNPAFGGQSAHIAAPASHVTAIDGLSDEQGVMLALAATALHGVDVGAVAEGARVLVLGQGVVGQLAARFARARGAHVTVTDKVAARLRLAEADLIVDANAPPENFAKAQFDILIDATGKMEAIAPVLMNVKKGGRVVLLGYYDKVVLPYQPLFLRELTLASSSQWAPGDLVRARDAIASGAVDVRPLLTHRMRAVQAHEAFDAAFENPECVKMILEWDRESESDSERGKA
jgi:3-hydroxyethyl bacteriochlorophyllide a dehydrogenase